MANSADLFQTVNPARTAEYEELLHLTVRSPGPPHQILSFCHARFGDDTAQGVVQDFAQQGRGASLDTMTAEFEKRYCGPRSGSGWLDRRELRKIMEPLWQRLRHPLLEATKVDPNWQIDHWHLLELQGSQVCGETLLTDYDSGRVAGRMAVWNRTAARLVKRSGRVADCDVLTALSGSDAVRNPLLHASDSLQG
jgi:hypothetical protein